MENLPSIFKETQHWMSAYIKSFYSDNEDVQWGISLKEKHTGYVTAISKQLARHLRLSRHDVKLAELMGLLHDVGRFRQYQLYQTFDDAISEDHADLGITVISNLPCLQNLSVGDRKFLHFAIRNHNKKDIEPTDNKRALVFARLLRDADKLDIYRVLLPFMEPSDGSGISPDFMRQFVNGEQVDYTKRQTADDRKLARLMWAYDVNYSWTLRRIVARGYINRIIDCLPKSEDMTRGVERLRDYVAKKCRETDRVF